MHTHFLISTPFISFFPSFSLSFLLPPFFPYLLSTLLICISLPPSQNQLLIFLREIKTRKVEERGRKIGNKGGKKEKGKGGKEEGRCRSAGDKIIEGRTHEHRNTYCPDSSTGTDCICHLRVNSRNSLDFSTNMGG